MPREHQDLAVPGGQQMAGHRVRAALVVVVDRRRRYVALQWRPAHQHEMGAGRVQGAGEPGHAQLVLVVVVGATEQHHGGDALLAHHVDQRELALGVVSRRTDQREPAAQCGGPLDTPRDMGERGAGDVVDEDRHRGCAAAGQGAGVGVGDVVQVPDHLHHPAAQFLRDRVVARQDAGDAGDGDARPLRHVPDGGPSGVARSLALTHPGGSFTVAIAPPGAGRTPVGGPARSRCGKPYPIVSVGREVPVPSGDTGQIRMPHLVHQGPAGRHLLQLLHHDPPESLQLVPERPGDMRCEKHVRQPVQRRTRRQRFGLGDIEYRIQSTGDQLVGQCVGVDERPRDVLMRTPPSRMRASRPASSMR